MTTLNTQVRDLLDETITRTTDESVLARLTSQRDRLDEPLRVAIAGKVKAVKSTVLNALVGEELAPTDAGECTKIVTWYREGLTRRVHIVPTGGEPRETPFTREGGAIDIPLNGHTPDTVDRIEVEWPSSALREMTLIDTPGISSLSQGISERTERLLSPGDDGDPPADAVIYLLKHLHSSDLDFLEAFRDEEAADTTSVNAVALIARADEIGVGRVDAMVSADRIAARYRAEPRLRALVQTVLPVAALIGQAGATLTEADYRAFTAIAGMEPAERDALLLSSDRFGGSEAPNEPDGPTRRGLLSRYGMFGIRTSVGMISEGRVASAPQLSIQLVERSGLPELRAYLHDQFAARRDALKARSALVTLESIAEEQANAGDSWLASEVERLSSSAHELVELRLLDALRSSTIDLMTAEVAGLERLLGREGVDPLTRLGLSPEASPTEVRQAAGSELQRWQRRAESPMSSPDVVYAARVAIRTCEGILAEMKGG